MKPAGIRDIAHALNVSIGTVDRALHDRPGISPKTRQKILDAAKSLGYRPNLAARFLSSRKELCIGVSLPREIRSYWDNVREGILDGARPFESTGVRVLFRDYPRVGVEDLSAFESIARETVQGLIIAPGDPEDFKPLILQAARRGIPTLIVSTDAPGTERLTAVSTDSFTNGSVVGELMGRFLPRGGNLLFITGQLRTADHAQKFAGFQQGLGLTSPKARVLRCIEAHDSDSEAYKKCHQAFRKHPKIDAVYVSTANSMPVLRAMEDLGLIGKVTAITTDLVPELVPLIQAGIVAATIHQRPREQGRLAFQALYRYLTEDVTPPLHVYLAPHIVMRSNLNLFLHELPLHRTNLD